MNAVEQSVRSSAERASEKAPPATPAEEARAAGRSIEARLVERLLSLLGNPAVEFLLWTGERVRGRPGETLQQLHIKDRGTLFTLFKDSQVGFGDAFSEGRVTIEGDLVAFLETLYQSMPRGSAEQSLLRRFMSRRRGPRANTLGGSRENIHRHYDIGNEFYQLWLGRTMSYTCAYYPTPAATLDEAQVAKMHHVCRKLQLQSGQSVVEAGCGWGSLGLHMARLRRRRVSARRWNTLKRITAISRAPTMRSSRSACSNTWDLRTIPSSAASPTIACRVTAAASSIPSAEIARRRCMHGSSGAFSRAPTRPRLQR
jgi:cyclopropane-fatty-acyl-phospholipid synthase